ncbi:MAG: D-alanyl-D-alaninecarboxypeptidase/D-alanyl-D-al anine-endopeptidase [Bacteroidota bacterium]
MKNTIYLWLIFAQFAQSQNSIQQSINIFVNNPLLKHASVGISVVDLDSNYTVAAYQPNLSLIPASTLKLLVTSSALGILGPDYTYITEIITEGESSINGELRGNLVIKGSGDPTLGSPVLTNATSMEDLEKLIIETLSSLNIKKINGYVIADETIFSSSVLPDSWQWDDLGNYYGAGSYGLNILDNTFELEFERSLMLGNIAQVKTTYPKLIGLNFKNQVKLAPQGTGDQAYIFGEPNSTERMLRGTIPIGNSPFKIKGALPNPPLFLASKLKDTLEQIGIPVLKGAATRGDLILAGINPMDNATRRARVYSPPLTEIVNEVNLLSMNMYAETLLKTISVFKGRQGDTEDGIAIEKEFWNSKGLNFSGVFLKDGSGLSARNAIPARFLTELLTLIYKDEKIYPHFYKSLPVAGVSGNQKERMKNSPASGNLRVKSGTLERVKGYAGYFEKNMKKYAFSILVNNYEGSHSDIRKEIESLMIAFCK